MVWKSNWPSPVITRLVLISALSMSTKSSTMSTPLRNLPFRKAIKPPPRPPAAPDPSTLLIFIPRSFSTIFAKFVNA